MIRPSEGRTLAYLGLLALANGLGFAFGRGSSDALFFKRFGVEYLPHMFFLTSVFLVVFSTVYVEFTDRVRPARMLLSIFFVLAAFLLLSWVFMAHGSSTLAFAAYFLGVSVAAEIIGVHFSLYASQFFDFNQTKRLTPLIEAVARLGRVLGGLLLVLVAKNWPTEVAALIWLGVIICLMGIVALRHHGEPHRPKLPSVRRRAPFADVREGLRFARHSPLLQLTGAGVFLMIILISILDYVASTIITNHYQSTQDLAAFFGWFYAITNAAVLLAQLALANHMVHRFGMKVVNLIFPCTTAASFALLSLSASFIPALIGRFNYMGLMPAFRTPVFNLFYSALPRYIQGRARAMSVGLILPLGLACAGLLLLWVPKSMLGQPLAMAGLALSFLYIYIKYRKHQVYSKTLLALIQHQVFSDKSPIQGIGRFSEELAQRVVTLVRQAESLESARTYVDLLIEHATESAAALLRQDLHTLPAPTVAYLMAQLAPSALAPWRAALQNALHHENTAVRIAATQLIEARGEQASLLPLLNEWLSASNPALQTQALRILLQHPDLQPTATAEACLSNLLQGEAEAQIKALSALEALADTRRLQQASTLRDAPNPAVRAAALRCCVVMSADAAQRYALLQQAAQAPEGIVRAAAAHMLSHLAEAETRLALLQDLLRDPEFSVRRAAQVAVDACMPQTAQEFTQALTAYADQFALQTQLCTHLAGAALEERDSLLLAVAQAHLSAAYDKKALTLRCPSAPSVEMRFLHLLLKEDIQQHVDLILEILCLLDRSPVMLSVQAALKSENRRLRAQALESLHNAAHEKWMLDLCAFLESELDNAPLPHHSPGLPRSDAETLQWCTRHGSVWLRQCASRLLQTNNDQPEAQGR